MGDTVTSSRNKLCTRVTSSGRDKKKKDVLVPTATSRRQLSQKCNYNLTNIKPTVGDTVTSSRNKLCTRVTSSGRDKQDVLVPTATSRRQLARRLGDE